MLRTRYLTSHKNNLTTSDFEYGEGSKGKKKNSFPLSVFRFPFRSWWLITTLSGNK